MGLSSFLIALPLAGGIVTWAVRRPGWARGLALGTSVVTFLASLYLWRGFSPDVAGYQFVESYRWVPDLGISYHVGVDGISLFLVLLTTFLIPISMLASWESIQEKKTSFYGSLLLLEASMIGVFLAIDVFLFYVFWEVMLVPMYLLIGVWGGERRLYAALKFFIFTMAGSVLMLVGILVCFRLYFEQTGLVSFNLLDWRGLVLPLAAEKYLFLAFFAAFAVKVPLFPLHTWLPDAHVEAPTAGSVLLAGVLLKMGTYGMLRFAVPLFPTAATVFAPAILTLAVIGILYGALVAMVQPDVKKLVAYSSVSHMGFVVLGIFSFEQAGLQGALFQMLSHGLSTGGLFLLVGMLYDRRHTRLIDEFGGLKAVMPRYATFFLVTLLASIGLPGLNGFVGEFLILLGAFQSARPFAVAGALGVVLAALYMLRMYQRMMLGPVTGQENRGLKDLGLRELAVLIPLVALMVWMGVRPQTLLGDMDASVRGLLTEFRSAVAVVQ